MMHVRRWTLALHSMHSHSCAHLDPLSLCRSFQLLDDMVERAKQGDGEAARAVPALLQQCISCNLRFESAIATCIGVA